MSVSIDLPWGAPHKKQPWGPHSRKKRAAPVEAWSISTNLPWRAPRKNTAQAIITDSILLGLYRLGAINCFNTEDAEPGPMGGSSFTLNKGNNGSGFIGWTRIDVKYFTRNGENH